ncbi:MAG: signal peptide peptidase SppA [Novosphingobium sp.]|nr:signal peptide peptidase SppA [Novosphingobium sp.]
MEFARKVWKLLVALKDGLALLFLLLFFVALYGLMSVRPGPGQVREGALLLDLGGVIVEEPAIADPLSMLLSAETPLREFRARDVARALRLAAKDDRIKVVVLDLSGFLGGGLVHIQEVGEAIDEVRAAEKPVLAFATAYVDDSVMLAAHASEVWIDPMGGAFVTGPGGNHLYYGPLLKKLNVTANIYRVGTFKNAVEPYILDGPSPASQEAYELVYGSMWQAWKDDVAQARPKADIERITGDPVAWVEEANGDLPMAAKNAGLVDRIGNRTDFGIRVSEIAGEDSRDKTPGSYAFTDLASWLAANMEKQPGKAIGVITIAGEIVDGSAGPGTAGGDRIAGLLDDALESELSALVVRVDSPGGSIFASEQIRGAIERFAEQDIPVVVSMANVAASGGVWVSTPASQIFAEPGTVTGSIGVFAILPTFDKALAELGVTGGGVKTTPLSGQPDLLTGLAPEISAIIQANVENSYRKFLRLVGKSRGMTVEQVEVFAEGRPWDGGSARELGLIDQFGGLDDALAFAAKAAELEDGDWHASYLGQGGDGLGMLVERLSSGDVASRSGANDIVGIAAQYQRTLSARVMADAERLLSPRGAQAYCLECPPLPSARPQQAMDRSGLARLARLLGIAER